MEVRLASENFGCFIDDFDAAAATSDDIRTCRDLLFHHAVLFLENQNWSVDDHVRIARLFGPIVINRYFAAVAGRPEVATVITEPGQGWVIGEKWHTDHSYDRAPAMGSILYAVETPPHGGDTCFATMQAAFDALDPALRVRLERLSAGHESRHVFAPSEAQRAAAAEARGEGGIAEHAREYPEAVHPIVVRHPETGRKGLFVNPEFTTSIVGMAKQESDRLLAELFDHILQPQFLYRFKWRPGSVAIWDNRSTWHRAMNDYQGYRRHMHRITISGTSLAGERVAA